MARHRNPVVLSVRLSKDAFRYINAVATFEASQGVHRVHARKANGTAAPLADGVHRIYSGKNKGKYRRQHKGRWQVFQASNDDEAKVLMTTSCNTAKRQKTDAGDDEEEAAVTDTDE